MALKNSQEVLQRQLMLDFCLSEQELAGTGNVFTVWHPMPGRRMWHAEGDCFLKAASWNGRLLMSGREDIIERCRQSFRDASAEWFMDMGAIRRLDDLLQPYGYRVGQTHPFYIPGHLPPVPVPDFEVIRYDKQAIQRFRGDERFDEAFAFDPVAPDVLGIAAMENGCIIGMAGASCDSPLMWQMGVNVDPQARGRGVGSTLVRLLMEDVYAAGAIPFYGTSQSHIASQRVAIRAGFLPGWAQLSVETIPHA